MAKTVQIITGVFLLFIGVVVFILLFIGLQLGGSGTSSPSSDSDFPIIILVPIFFGVFIPIIAAIRKRR